MFLLFAALLLTASFLPVSLTATLSIYQDARLHTDISILGMKVWERKASISSSEIRITARHGEPAEGSAVDLRSSFGRMIASFRSTAGSRRFLLRHIRILHSHAFIRLHTDDAARTAILTGLLRMLSDNLPSQLRSRTVLRIMPEFRSSTAIRAQGIISCRVGILILTGAIRLYERLARR